MSQVEEPIMEEKRKKLEEIKSLYKELDHSELDNHGRSYIRNVKIKQWEREQRKQQFVREFSEKGRDIQLGKIVEEEMRRKKEEEQKKSERREISKKMKDYYAAIKDTVLFKSESRSSIKELSNYTSNKSKDKQSINSRYNRNKILGSSSVVDLKAHKSDNSIAN